MTSESDVSSSTSSSEVHAKTDKHTTVKQRPDILTVPELAEYLRIGRSAAYELVRTGVVPHVRIGRLVRIPRDALLRWLAEDASRSDEIAK